MLALFIKRDNELTSVRGHSDHNSMLDVCVPDLDYPEAYALRIKASDNDKTTIALRLCYGFGIGKKAIEDGEPLFLFGYSMPKAIKLLGARGEKERYVAFCEPVRNTHEGMVYQYDERANVQSYAVTSLPFFSTAAVVATVSSEHPGDISYQLYTYGEDSERKRKIVLAADGYLFATRGGSQS